MEATPQEILYGTLKNHLFEKENHLNQTFIFRFHVSFQGCQSWGIYGIMGIRPMPRKTPRNEARIKGLSTTISP